jgi:Transglutaminase-like superfamily
MMPWLVARAWCEFVYMDLVALRGFRTVCDTVGRTKVCNVRPAAGTVDMVVSAMKRAGALYFKQVLCLQRSAVVTRLLRQQGVAADLMIGCRMPPFEAHAWVEVEGTVVSDDRYGLEFYRVIDKR